MTDYCTVAQIEVYFPSVTFSTTTKVTLASVEALITTKSLYIDARLNVRYETPITGANSLIIIQEICEWLVISQLEPILKTGLGRRGDAIPPIDYKAKADKKLTEHESSKADLPDASSRSGDEFKNYNEDNEIDPIFERDTDQW